MNFKIFDGRGSFYQWDLNQKLIVDGITLNDEIHFKNIDGTGALVVKPYSSEGNILVDVPNVLLQKANSITVWVYVNNDHTKEQAVFNVIPRQKPADYIYTPTEVSVWKVLEEAVENIPNEYAKKNHVHSQYLTAETDPSVEDWAKKGSEYEITGNPVTLENIEHMPMKVVTTLEPIQSGSGDPSPSNIRTISGWTGAKLTRCGKNLLNPNNMINAKQLTKPGEAPAIKNGYGWKRAAGNTEPVIGQTNNLTVMKVNTTYTVSFVSWVIEVGSTISLSIDCYPDTLPETSINITSTPTKYSWTFSTTDEAIESAKIRFFNTNNYDVNICVVDVQLEKGSTATAYEPYHGNTYTADFGQTVYGGTLDWQTGVLTVEWGYKAFDGTETWILDAYINCCYTPMNTLEKTNDYITSIKCSTFRTFNTNSDLTSNVGISGFYDYGNHYPGENWIYFNNGVSTTATELKEWLSAQYAAGTPVQVCYKLATPTTIQLTAHEIEALQGTNTLYGDGSLTVSGSKDVYWLSKNLLERIKTLESAIISLGGNV